VYARACNVYKTSSLTQKLIRDGEPGGYTSRVGRCAGLRRRWWRQWINLVVVVIVTGRALYRGTRGTANQR